MYAKCIFSGLWVKFSVFTNYGKAFTYHPCLQQAGLRGSYLLNAIVYKHSTPTGLV